MKKYVTLLSLSCLLFHCGCGSLRNTSRTALSSDFYTLKQVKGNEKVYLENDEWRIRLFAVKPNEDTAADTSRLVSEYGQVAREDDKDVTLLKRNSFDIDFLAIPLKFRPTNGGVPAQLNTEINASAYFGLRTDRFSIGYEPSSLGIQERIVRHFGFSFGVLTGIGSTLVNPTTTNDQTVQEYDGIVWTKGVAGIFAINTFTIGVSIGFDNLLDQNRTIWIYESKPWIGFTFGLNLN